MSLKNWSTTASSNTSTPPNGAPESSTTLADTNDIMRHIMADVRTLAASDTIASATTTDIGTKDNTFLTVSGTTTITGLGTVSAGIWKVLIFDDALTFTHNATSLILPTGANITTAAGDVAVMLSLGSGNWRCLVFQRKSGNALAVTGALLAANNFSDIDNVTTAQQNLSLEPGVDVQAYDADTLKADTADVLTAGFATTPYNAGTKSTGTFTPDEANGNLQYAINGGAHTLAPMTNNGTVIIQYTNNASAGAVTTTGFTKVTGSFTTTNGDDFMCYLTVNNSKSHLTIVALQ